MVDRNLVQAIVLMAIAAAFGLQSLRYPIGTLDRAGPGLFPLMVSSLLLLVGMAIAFRSFLAARIPLQFNAKNLAVIIASVVGFALLSNHVNMLAGEVFLVFCATLAGSSYSVIRNLKITAILVGISLGFRFLLGFHLPLY